MSPDGEAGASLLELMVTVALIATVTGFAVPLVARARDEHVGRSAAMVLAGQFRLARQVAILEGRNTAVVFDVQNNAWVFVLCRDHDGDGVLRTDVAAGVDACQGSGQSLAAWFSDASIDRAANVPDLSGNPAGAVVAFGISRMASFSPTGTASSGSVTVRTRGGHHFAVRLAGVTGRVRLWRFVKGSGRWLES